jgi:hypothetical protein
MFAYVTEDRSLMLLLNPPPVCPKHFAYFVRTEPGAVSMSNIAAVVRWAHARGQMLVATSSSPLLTLTPRPLAGALPVGACCYKTPSPFSCRVWWVGSWAGRCRVKKRRCLTRVYVCVRVRVDEYLSVSVCACVCVVPRRSTLGW